MSTAECLAAKKHRTVSLVLFTIGAVILIFNVLIILLSAYVADPIVDTIAGWLWGTGMLLVFVVVAIVLMIIAAAVNISTNKTLVTCILK